MISFFTLAGGQTSSDPSSVDPRTGQFSTTIQLGHVNGNKLRGPAMPFGLSYSPFATEDYGFGQGWSMPWTTYNASTGDQYGTLYTAEGSNFKVETGGDQPQVTQQKPTVIGFNTFSNGVYKVSHVHGAIESLASSVNNVYVPNYIYTALGNRYTLNWSQGSSVNAIQSILDDDGNTVLSASTPDGSSLTLTLNPDSTDEQVIIYAELNQGLLQTLRVADWKWQFTYTDVGEFDPQIPQLLKQIVHPTGLVEAATYSGGQIQFPTIAGQSIALPAVTSYTKTPNGGQLAQVCQYVYGGQAGSENFPDPQGNFLGFGAEIDDWEPNRDNLYYATQPYSYTTLCQEMTADGQTVVSSIQRTFTQYHGIQNETRTKNLCSLSRDYTYGNQVNGGYDAQTDNSFLLPTQTTMTYTGPDGNGGTTSGTPESFTDTYDPDTADRTQHTTSDGIITTYEYYPIDGDGDDCPADPNGLDCPVKSITTQYPAINGYDAMTRLKTFTHCQVSVGGTVDNEDNPIPYAVCPHVETTTIDGTKIHSLEYEYKDSPGDPDHGRVTKVTETVFDANGQSHVSHTAFTYTHDDTNHLMTTKKTVVTEDLNTFESSSVYSTWSGRAMKNIDELGVETDYTYDVHGRELTRTEGAGSSYERTWTYAYALETPPSDNGSVNVPTETITHPSPATGVAGAQEKLWYDGSMREIRHQRYITKTIYNGTTTYNKWMDVATSTYDDQGHLVATKQFDWRTAKIPLFQPATTIHYDDWGRADKTTYASGAFDASANDPVAKTTTVTWNAANVGQASRVISYNDQNLPTTVAVYDKDGAQYSTTSRQYDGARRVRQMTDEYQNTVSIAYDVWSRPYQVTLPDQSVVTRTYEDFAGLDLVTEITVKDGTTGATTSLGTQKHDGLHRVTETTIGGRTTTHHFANSGPVPDYTTEPDGTRVDYTYIKEFDCAVATETAGGVALTFSYDDAGRLTSASGGSGPNIALSIDEWGHLQSRTVTFDTNRVRTENYGNSAFGQLMFFQAPLQTLMTHTVFNYDFTTGLPDSDAIGATKTITYTFTNGVLTGWQNLQTGATATLTLDEFLRETDRSVTRGSSTFDISQEYYLNGMMQQQTSTLGGATLRQDNFTYDKRNRLTKFTSTGTALAVDPYGKSISEQDFVYDGIDNLQSVTTTFSGGSDTATYTYDTTDACQLKSIAHSSGDYPQSISLLYDLNGRMTTDDASRTLTYDSFGRLETIDGGGSNTTDYYYDALGVRREQSLPSGSSLEYYYRGHYPITVINHTSSSDQSTSWLRMGGNCMVEMTGGGSKDVVTDAGASVVATGNSGGLTAKSYTAYGFAPPSDNSQSALGFNGEYTDPFTGNYQLWNGYRALSC
jgi:YD repeat-containing protein